MHKTEENNRMGKTRDFFKKIRDTKGIFHAQMSTIKDRNGKDVTEAEDINMKWQEHTEELYKKGHNDPDNNNGVVTHQEPDILECEVNWDLGSITTNKASGGYGIPAELFQILKDDVVKVLHSICWQIWKISSGHKTGKCQFSFQSQRKAMPKHVQTTIQLHSFHMLARLCSETFKLGFSSTRTENFQVYKLSFEEAEESEIKLPTFIGSWRKQGSSRKTSTSASLTMLKPLVAGITTNCGKFFKRWK